MAQAQKEEFDAVEIAYELQEMLWPYFEVSDEYEDEDSLGIDEIKKLAAARGKLMFELCAEFFPRMTCRTFESFSGGVRLDFSELRPIWLISQHAYRMVQAIRDHNEHDWELPCPCIADLVKPMYVRVQEFIEGAFENYMHSLTCKERIKIKEAEKTWYGKEGQMHYELKATTGKTE